MKNAYKIVVGKPESKISLPITRRAWKGTIKMDLKEIACEVYWIHLAQDSVNWRAVVSRVIKLGEFPNCLREYQFLKENFALLDFVSFNWFIGLPDN
jgi:hypothetical protein